MHRPALQFHKVLSQAICKFILAGNFQDGSAELYQLPQWQGIQHVQVVSLIWKSCQKNDLKALMVYQTAGQVQMSCIIQIQTADMGYLSLAPSAYMYTPAWTRSSSSSIICTVFMQMKLSTTHNSYSRILGITRTHTNISIPINRPPDGSEQSFYTLHHCSKTLYPFATSAPWQGAVVLSSELGNK